MFGGILPQKRGRKCPFLVFLDQNPDNQRFYAFIGKFFEDEFFPFFLARVLNNLLNYTFKHFPGWALQIRSSICDFRYDLVLTSIFHVKNPDSVKNILLSKNPQFLSDHYEMLTKEGTLEDLLLTKFRNDRVKIVDFLLKAFF